jgi:hypothetical protein
MATWKAATPASIENGSSFGKVDGKKPHEAHSSREHSAGGVINRVGKLHDQHGPTTTTEPYSPYNAVPSSKAEPSGGSSTSATSNMKQQVSNLESSTQGL